MHIFRTPFLKYTSEWLLLPVNFGLLCGPVICDFAASILVRYGIIFLTIGLVNQQKTFSGQKQPFTDVLRNSCSYKFRNIFGKTPVLESLFNKLGSLKACYFIKKRFRHGGFPVNIVKFLRTAFFYTTSPVAAYAFFLR